MSSKFDGMSDQDIVARIRTIRESCVRQGIELDSVDGLPVADRVSSRTITREILDAQSELYRRHMPEA